MFWLLIIFGSPTLNAKNVSFILQTFTVTTKYQNLGPLFFMAPEYTPGHHSPYDCE